MRIKSAPLKDRLANTFLCGSMTPNTSLPLDYTHLGGMVRGATSVADPDPHVSALFFLEAGSGSALKSLGGPWMLTIKAWRPKMEPWKLWREEVADFHHLDKEQDPNPH
jgi:hypothetical protein